MVVFDAEHDDVACVADLRHRARGPRETAVGRKRDRSETLAAGAPQHEIRRFARVAVDTRAEREPLAVGAEERIGDFDFEQRTADADRIDEPLRFRMRGRPKEKNAGKHRANTSFHETSRSGNEQRTI